MSEETFPFAQVESLLKQSVDKLESIDKSIDFLAAAMTGLDPLDISIAQGAFGRLQRVPQLPHLTATSPAGARETNEKMIKIDPRLIEEIIEDEIREIMELPSDLSTPAGPEEDRMDALSKSWEELITARILDGETGIWSNTDVVDPVDGERRALDEFLAILGNYVVSDEIDEGTARDLVKSIANQISDNLFEPNPHEWGIPLPKWENMPGFEPQDELQEEGVPTQKRKAHHETHGIVTVLHPGKRPDTNALIELPSGKRVRTHPDRLNYKHKGL